MIHRPKLMIKRKVILNNRGHYRHYSADYNPELGKLTGSERPQCPIIDLELYPQVKTEKQLLRGIFERWGEGEYLIFAFLKGRKGTWVFWKGPIDEQGFLRKKRVTKFMQAKQKIKEEMVGADSDEVDSLKEDIDIEREFKEKESDYGLMGHLKRSGLLGHFTGWEEEPIQNKENFEQWQPKKSEEEKAPSNDWGIDKSRSKKNQEQFEVWK